MERALRRLCVVVCLIGDEMDAGGIVGSSEADRVVARPWMIVKNPGNTTNVANVAAASPPITARPSGAVCSPPSPNASAMGIMPVIMAALVIKMGRNLLCAASTAASPAWPLFTRFLSANVVRRIAFATATPMAMMAPMND